MPTVRLPEDSGYTHYYNSQRRERIDAGEPYDTGDDEFAAYLVEEQAFEYVGETCEAVKGDGEVCGRDLPCPYHSEDS